MQEAGAKQEQSRKCKTKQELAQKLLCFLFFIVCGFLLGDLLSRPNPRADVLFRGAHLLTERHRQTHAGTNDTQILFTVLCNTGSQPLIFYSYFIR